MWPKVVLGLPGMLYVCSKKHAEMERPSTISSISVQHGLYLI